METAKDIKALNQLMEDQLRLIFESEMQLAKTLPRIYAEATDPRLSRIIDEFRERNEKQIFHFKQAFQTLYRQKPDPTGRSTILAGTGILQENVPPKMKNERIIRNLQQMIRFQAAAFRSVCKYADTLGFYDVTSLFHINLTNVKTLDQKLKKLAAEVTSQGVATTKTPVTV